MDKMQPDVSKITIGDNLAKIETFLREVILAPRATMHKWSGITNQTPNLKIGYPGQHLASLILGMKGTGTGARGNDIVDGTEVKSCSRIDPLDKCNSCKGHVLRSQSVCPSCGSADINRGNDSKWLIGIRKKEDLDMYFHQIPRVFFLISDYPNFSTSDFTTLRFASFEIWNQTSRAVNFRNILNDYYYKIYLEHIKNDPKKTPAPKDFWPYSYQFYLCNPIKTFECIIHDADSNPRLEITTFVKPQDDRSSLSSENMPVELLKKKERLLLKKLGVNTTTLKHLGEDVKKLLPLRDTSKAMPQKQTYHRM